MNSLSDLLPQKRSYPVAPLIPMDTAIAPCFKARQLFLAVTLLLTLSWQRGNAADDFAFTKIWELTDANSTAVVHDLSNDGDVVFTLKQGANNEARLFRNGAVELLLSNYGVNAISILGGSANHSGSAALWVWNDTTGTNEIHFRKGLGPLTVVAARARNVHTCCTIEDRWEVRGVRVSDADEWAIIGRESHFYEGYVTLGSTLRQQISSYHQYDGSFGANWTGKQKRELAYTVTETQKKAHPGDSTWTEVESFTYGDGESASAPFINRKLALAADWQVYKYTGQAQSSTKSFLGVGQEELYSYTSGAEWFWNVSLSDDKRFLVALRSSNQNGNGLIYQFSSGINGPHTKLNSLVSSPQFVEVNSSGDILVAEANGKVSVYQRGSLKRVFTPGMTLFGGNATSFTLQPGCFNDRKQIAGLVTLNDGKRVVVRAGLNRELWLRALEITQSIQDWKNSTPLIEGKRTYVRAHLEHRKPSAGNLGDYSATLKLKRANEELSLPVTTASWNQLPFQAPEFADRTRLANTMNFEVPADWTSGTVTFSLEPNGFTLTPDDLAEDPQGTAKDGIVTKTFVPPAVVPLYLYKFESRLSFFDDPDSPSHMESPTAAAIWSSLESARNMLPVSKFKFHKPFGTITHKVWPGSSLTWRDIQMEAADTAKELFKYWPRGIVVLALEKSPPPAADGKTYAGLTTDKRDGLFAVVSEWSPNRTTLGHELGHAHGQPHPSLTTLHDDKGKRIGFCGEVAGDADDNFPFVYEAIATCTSEGGKIPFIGPILYTAPDVIDEHALNAGFWAFEPDILNVIDPRGATELMSYCDEHCMNVYSWPSIYTYTNVLSRIHTEFPPVPASGPLPERAARRCDGDTLVVRGFLNLKSDTVELLPFKCLPCVTAETPEPGEWRVEARDIAGDLVSQATFAAAPQTQAHSEESVWVVPFRVELPANPAVRHIEIWHGTTNLATRSATANPPTVTLLAPNGGETLNMGPFNIQWQTFDTDGDALTATVQFSYDGGTTWESVSMDNPTTNLTVRVEDLHASTNALVRVLVSDGFACAHDESDAFFTIANHGPQVVLSRFPTNGILYGSRPDTLEVFAMDQEDGQLGGTNVVWFSDHDGLLGTGERLQLPENLSSGIHLIKTIATDSYGNTSVISNTVIVYPFPPPTVQFRELEEDGAMGLEVAGNPFSEVVIESSTNLIHWMVWRRLAMTESFQLISETIGQSDAARFFRVRSDALPPTIISQPEDLALSVGDTLRLETTAVSTEPIDYFWLRDGNPVMGATNGTVLTIMNFQTAETGLYSVIASNRLGTTTSRFAVVKCRVGIVTPLTNVCHQSGSVLNLECQAVGSPPITYQWFKNGSAITSATNNLFVVGPMTTNDLGSFSVRVTNEVSTVFENAAIHLCALPLVVTTHLTNQCLDVTVTFQIRVTGSGPFAYMWYKDNVRIPAANGPTHTIQFPWEEDLGTYTVIVIDAFGMSVTESASLLDCF